MVLVDIQARQRVSETFHFDLNNDQLIKLIPTRLAGSEKVDPETCTPRALFRVGSLPPTPTSLYLVLRIEHVAHRDADDAADPYFKHATIKQKERAKFVKEMETACERLGKYTQPFAWSAVQVFDDKGNFILPKEVVVQNLTRIKDDHNDEKLYDLIKKREKDNKMKPLPGFFKMNVALMDDKELSNLPARIDPSYVPVHPAGNDYIKEIAWFDQERQEPVPAVDYVNHLYVYIESVNLNKWKGKGECKNIGVRVQLRDSDCSPDGLGLPAIYGGSSRSKLVTEYDTAIRINDKKPNYYHEVKVQLPCNIGPQHHLFFIFYNVGVKPKTATEAVCAYAYLPLLDEDGRILVDEPKRLPVAGTLVASYRSSGVEESIQWLDNAKPLFLVRTKLVSSLYTQDPHLHTFFKHYSSERNDELLEKAVSGLKNVSGRAQVHFFPVALNQLMYILCNMSPAASREAFISLPTFLNSVDMLTLPGRRTRNPNLTSYVEYLLDLPREAKTSLHEALVRQWLSLIRERHPVLAEVTRFAWFLFETIAKSMLLSLSQAGLFGDDARRKEYFGADYMESLSKLVHQLMRGLRDSEPWCAPVAADLNTSVGLFLKDLLSIMDRGAVLSMIDDYVSKICPANDSAVLVKFKFTILKIVCDYEHYVPLNIPISPGIVSVPALPAQFWKSHFLTGLLIHEVTACLPRDKLIRTEAITTLRWLMWKHDLDKRYQDPVAKQRVAGIYFPYILLVTERATVVQGMSEEERRDWLVCFVWIVRNCERLKLLRQWWRKDTIKNVKSFFLVMGLAVHTFGGVAAEAHLQRELGFTILDIIDDFMLDFHHELKEQTKEHMECMFRLLGLLLQSNACVSLLVSLFSTLRYFINTYPQTLFRWTNTSYCGDLCFEILRHCNLPHATIRSKAAALFYLLIKTNHAETKTIARMRLQSTIAVSRLTGTVKEYSFLTASLGAVTTYSKRDVRNGHLQAETESLCKRLLEVIKHSLDMADYAYDREMTSDLYYQVSLGYTDSPDLRVTWLDNLCNFHLEYGNFDEAVQCKMHAAALISEFLRKQKGNMEGIPSQNASFSPVSPNIANESGLPSISLDTGGEEGMYNPKVFSEEGLVRVLTDAINIGKNANLFELVIDIYKFIIDIHQKERDYGQLGECFRDLRTVCESLVKSNQERARLFSNYYRVAFFGKLWKDLQGKEFVYRANDTVRLNDFTTRLKAQFSKKFGDKVELLGNISVDLSKLKEDVCYFQVVSLTEYFEPSELTDRPNLWDRKFNISQFIFESPFTKSGKAHGDLADQCKRKTILHTAKSFPYVKSRLLVTGKKEIILEPIETAIELVEGRIAALRTELDTTPPNTKTLQQVLQGSVLVTVNAGPLAIAKIFLDKSADYPPQHVARLREVIINFVKLCQFALVLNKTLIQPEQEEFQVQLEAGYDTLKRELQAYLASGPKAGSP